MGALHLTFTESCLIFFAACSYEEYIINKSVVKRNCLDKTVYQFSFEVVFNSLNAII